MRTNILATAVALSDPDLLARIGILASHEREATAELVAHLAALEMRPSLYAAEGYGSLFDLPAPQPVRRRDRLRAAQAARFGD